MLFCVKKSLKGDIMYLSRVKLNLKKRKTVKALTTPTLFHGAVERSFGDERKRNLWRVDRLNDQYYLLIVSHDKPDLSRVVEQFGSEEFPAETKVNIHTRSKRP